MVRILGCHSCGQGSNPGGRTDILQAVQCGRRRKRKNKKRTSLVVQWLRVRLPMQRTRVQSLVQKDSTPCGATKPVHPCSRVHALHLLSWRTYSPCSKIKETTATTGPHTATRQQPPWTQLKKAHVQQQRPSIAKS